MTTIAVIGLGYVGLPLAVEFGKKYRTLGFDLSAEKVAAYGRHVDPTGQHLDWRPSQAVPEPREDRDRHPPIDDARAAKLHSETRVGPILPRAREEHQPARHVRGLQERPCQLVDILANAGPRAKGGTVIDENPHGVERTTETASPCGTVC